MCTCVSNELNEEADFLCSDNKSDQSIARKLRRRMENAVRNEDLPEQRVILKE